MVYKPESPALCKGRDGTLAIPVLIGIEAAVTGCFDTGHGKTYQEHHITGLRKVYLLVRDIQS